MSLAAMRFQGFSFPKNPTKLQITTERDLKEHNLPYAGSLVQDYGRRRRKVSGEGVFLGADAMEHFQTLSGFLEQGGSGLLILPDLPAMTAALVRLALIGETTPSVVRYSFEFWEDLSGTAESTGVVQGRTYRCRAGDDLWRIANQYHTGVPELLAVNPQLQWANLLREGEVVYLP